MSKDFDDLINEVLELKDLFKINGQLKENADELHNSGNNVVRHSQHSIRDGETEVLELNDSAKKDGFNGSENNNSKGIFQPQIFNKLRDDVSQFCQYSNHLGTIATVGYFDAGAHAGGEASQWWSITADADDLLNLIVNRTAEKVLTCIGNNDRLNLLLALLRKPNTVAGLVENFGYSSSGQVYHHLRPLLAADLVFEDKDSDVKGTYRVRPHRVQGIIILLEGIYYLTCTEFTKGDWDEAVKMSGGE